MRLVGVALLGAWLIAWSLSPHGEPARPTSIVGGVAVAGNDRAVLAWLELTHGRADRGGQLHLAYVADTNLVEPLFERPATADVVGFRLADAGDGRFVLATEHRARGLGEEHENAARHLVFERFQPGRPDRLVVTLDGTPQAGEWQMAAAGDQLVVAEDIGGRTRLWTLGASGAFEPARDADARVLLGAADGHLVRYEIGRHDDAVVLDPGRPGAWTAGVSKPPCIKVIDVPTRVSGTPPPTLCAAADVVSVIPLRGGWARLSRANGRGTLDGMRDGRAFSVRDLDLHLFAQARLSLERDGALAIYDVREGQIATRRIVVAEGRPPVLQTLAADGHAGRDSGGVRYRIFGRGGRGGVPALATRITPQETAVVFERHVGATTGPAQLPPATEAAVAAQVQVDPTPVVPAVSKVFAPKRAYLADRRPLLHRLALVPLLVLALGGLAPLRLLRRLRRLRVVSDDAALPAGPVTVEGTLSRDADAPEGGLRIKRARGPLRLFVEGAEVLRASDVRSRGEPRGDAVDVASGAPIVATGVAEPGAAFRGEDTLRARRGDLVIVGCTLAEAQARVASRLATTTLLLGGAAAIIAWVGFLR